MLCGAFDMVSEAISPDEAVLWQSAFVYRPCVHAILFDRALLLEWVAPRARVGRYGATGTVRLLQVAPGSAADEPVGIIFRIHVCCVSPCPAERWHPSKYGSCPPPRAHGYVEALVEAASVANLASYVTVAGGREDEVAASANAEASGGDHHMPSSVDETSLSSVVLDKNVEGVRKTDGAALLAHCAKGTAEDSIGVASTSVESDIRARGDVVRRCGTYVGLFEIIVFCALRR